MSNNSQPFAGIWPLTLANVVANYKSASNASRTYRNHLYIVGLEGQQSLRLSGFSADERNALTVASMRLANNQINEACNKFYATVQLAHTVRERTFSGKEGLSADTFCGEFILGALIPVLYYSQVATLLSLLSSYGLLLLRDRRDKQQRNVDSALRSSGWADEWEFLLMRTPNDWNVMSRRKEGHHTRFHKQLLNIAQRFSASGTDVVSFDFELLDQLKALREQADYSVLGETSLSGAIGLETYLKYLPRAYSNICFCIQTISCISGITNRCDVRFQHHLKPLLEELLQHPYSIKLELWKQFPISFTLSVA